EAEQNFLKAIELNPTFAENYAQLGLLYRKMGQTARGDEFLQRALSWDPSNETAVEALRSEDPKKGILKGIFGS
ncbi:MAG: tetratricopeptide repeat protein, partial [Acidobacteria bacterium]|nr:tetratricopeptide repeat protein [Acidobacteriota bacterium]